ncbi:hypothetical protein [Polyangium aurulentum]|uniref:hypothetical protein n=1 Tax=Polyangium aurulentum TaxID=2567896 RepID=UPI0010AE1BC1|nr:hypothetical protein [Polyangium aurulentum]UQA60353.1 hypothetical protein E8A73_007730 [Polyangium aurulentum]
MYLIRRFSGLIAAACALTFVMASGCGSEEAGVNLGGEGGAGGAGGSGGSGAGNPTGGSTDPAAAVFPDIASLHATGMARTCALNDGVCHSARQYPELGSVKDLVALVNAPCQVASNDPAHVPDECERPGDLLVLGDTEHEILRVLVDPKAPFPPVSVEVRLAGPAGPLDGVGARIRRLGDAGAETLSVPLDGATFAPGADASSVIVQLGSAPVELRRFLDVRSSDLDRVRVGDANGNGTAHASATPWALVTPGDPSRSYLYKRLINDAHGPKMPLLQRTWSALATRAVWCWIRGLPADATAATVSVSERIDYEDCPSDPDAPDPNATGTWSSVRTLMGSRCATAGCHNEAVKAGALDLSPNSLVFQQSVIGVPSVQQMGALRVVPGQPQASYLLCKVDPECDSRAPMTALMPITGNPLTEAEIKSISEWILNGAPLE